MQSNDSNTETVNDDIGADVAASIEKLKSAATEEVAGPVETTEAAPAPEAKPIEPQEPVKKYDVPNSFTPAFKEKWNDLPDIVKAEIHRREEETHKMVTRHDGELNLGREIKEVISPYMPIIQAEGGTPVTAVRDLLNTAYVLRTGSPEQKLAVVQSVCAQYGVNIAEVNQEKEYVDPTINQLQQELARLREQANPDALYKQLKERQERDTLQAEAKAFSLNPENKYFTKVQPFMASLLGEGVAKDLKEAYDMACNAHPEVRSILEAERKAADAEKRKSEIRAKQNAASSISGSPATLVSNANSQDDSIEAAVRAAIRQSSGKI